MTFQAAIIKGRSSIFLSFSIVLDYGLSKELDWKLEELLFFYFRTENAFTAFYCAVELFLEQNPDISIDIRFIHQGEKEDQSRKSVCTWIPPSFKDKHY